MNPIETAISTQREGAIAIAVNEMSAFIEREIAKLEAVGGVRDDLYRLPKNDDSRETYIKLKNQRIFIQAITRQLPNNPRVFVRDSVKIMTMLESAANDAAASFDSYVAKLNKKIGKDVVKAEIVGQVWQESYLTITRAAGDVEVWKTQMIVNVSSLGNFFNQWPTRRLKNKAA